MTESVPSQWAYSTNGEEYHGEFDTRDEAIDEAIAESDDDIDTIWVAPIARYFPDLNDLSDIIIEKISEQSYDVCGEFAEGYLEGLEDITLKDELKACVERWLTKHGEWPAKSFWSIDVAEQVDVVEWKAVHHKELKT